MNVTRYHHNPSEPTNQSSTLAINVSNIISSQNKFSANVTFDNKLGRTVNILNKGCMDNGHFIPSFIIQFLNNGQWIGYASPGCPAIDAGMTVLISSKQFSTTLSMLIDSTLGNGTYRLRFDIREEDITKQIPSEYLQSNSFTVSK